jgi:exonuclease SbcC
VLADLDAQLARDRAGLETSARLADVLAERLATLQAQDDDRIVQLVETVGEGLDVEGHVARVHRRDEAAQAVLAALRDLAGAEADQKTAGRAADRSLRAAGFATLVQARGSILDPATVTSLRAAAQSRRDQQQRAQAELADPEVAAAAAAPAQDLGALQAQHTAAREQAAEAAECSSVLAPAWSTSPGWLRRWRRRPRCGGRCVSGPLSPRRWRPLRRDSRPTTCCMSHCPPTFSPPVCSRWWPLPTSICCR